MSDTLTIIIDAEQTPEDSDYHDAVAIEYPDGTRRTFGVVDR